MADPGEGGGGAQGDAAGFDECDIVMKGGIASGVIYPLVVYELAKKYRFRNIGGTSAGAIAAVATAAAEYGRRTGKGTGFDGLATIPEWLGQRGRLLAMFQPSRSTRPLFRLLLAVLRGKGTLGKIVAALGASVRSSPLVAGLGAVPGILLVASVLPGGASGMATAYGILCGLMLAGAGGLAAAAAAMALKSLRALPRNFYGICTGIDRSGGRVDRPLTDWLTHLINELAGHRDHRPVTFGDLWSVDEPGADLKAMRNLPARRGINLEVVTTCISHGRPYRIPFDTNVFYYDPAEWRRLFPEMVMVWIDRNQREPGPGEPTVRAVGVPMLRPLPLPEHLPIVVAARMSLSFPVLLGAVPLYAVDFTLEENADWRRTRKPVRAERCWFSDGGICSNFPIHFFDQPIPRRPTFGVNLRDFPADHAPADASEASMEAVKDYDVWTPPHNNAGWHDIWTRFDAGPAGGRLSGFVGAILGAMQNWRDTSLTRMPGYRDRIVHISQAPWEGGMNLDMAPEVIARLGARGSAAGDVLLNRPPGWWDDHRWVRYRSIMALLEEVLDHYEQGYADTRSRSMAGMIVRPKGADPRSYPLADDAERLFARDVTDALVQLCRYWKAQVGSFQDGAPRPEPEMQVGPKY